jgi:alpha-beta hydrolase superfamily lysophospholipase
MENMSEHETSSAIARRSAEKIHFDHKDMDYYLAWVMGRHVFDASDRADCMATAARIPNGDIAAWQAEWRNLAQQTEAEAQATQGDRAAARKAYLSACTYYRAPLFLMPPHQAEFRADYQKMRACFQAAAPLGDSPIEQIEISYQGKMLFGYYQQADAGPTPRPTLIIFGGIETFAEDCYLMIGPTASSQGYNVLTVDLPGQGNTPEQGLYFGARMEGPVQAVVDYALSRPEVDGERLAIYGFSWGGHIVFKGAQHDRRIKAMIANPPMPDVFRATLAQQQGHNRNDPVAKAAFQQIAWRMGLRISFNPLDIARRIGKAYDYFFHGKADAPQITCPTLCLAGEAEASVTLEIARECLAKLPHPKKKLVIFSKADGSDAHCQVDNLSVPNQVIFAWLNEVFA